MFGFFAPACYHRLSKNDDQHTVAPFSLIREVDTINPRRINHSMNSRIKLKGLILIAAIIVGSFALSSSGETNHAARIVADGNALYASKCATCHAKDGRGIPNWRSKGQPDFTDAKWQKSRTDAQIAEATKNGKGKYMPAFKTKLSDEDIAAVVARVRAFAKK